MVMFSKKSIILKYKLLLATMLFALLFSCKEEEQAVMPDPTDSSTKYELPTVDFVKQIEVAENATAQWSVFNEFKNTLVSLAQADLERMRSQSEKLTRYSDSLRKQMPTSLETMPIKSRMDVVHARLELLQQSAEAWVVDSVELKNNYEESMAAFNILLHQINEKFDKDAIQMEEGINFSTELQQRTRDSIFNLEKAKQKK